MAMNTEMQSARDDLAYMRALVSEGGRFQLVGGQLFFWAGLIYGLQCVGHWLNIVGLLPLPPLGLLALGFGPTLVFLVVLVMVLWHLRKTPQASGVGSRAMGAVFQGAGLANLVMAFVFAYGATTMHNNVIWLYQPVVVCMFQGVAWYVAWTIRRRAWLAVVSAGWFATTVVCGVLITNAAYFILTLGVALILFMALPGYAMMRDGRTAAA
ncbi:MAG: hypothetical protein ABUL55_01200 [Pseudomonadota bacterium]